MTAPCLAATDGAPASWVGTRLEDRDDVPEDLKEAGRTVLGSASIRLLAVDASVSLQSMQHAVHLTVVDALPLRRVPTDLRALLRSALEVMQRQAKAFDVTLNVVVDGQVPAVVSLDAEKIAWAIDGARRECAPVRAPRIAGDAGRVDRRAGHVQFGRS